jgi:4-hydroxybenzoate polyprenyltransferase
VVLGYSLTKRFTALCHFILGLGLSLAPIGAYLVISGHFALEPVLFSLAVLSWVSGFDILYALPDADFDIGEKLFSIPATIGRVNALKLSRFLHICSAILVIIAGLHADLGLFYWLGVLVYSFLLIYQHTLVKPNDLSRLNLAFFTMNGIASVVFALFFMADHFVHIIL